MAFSDKFISELYQNYSTSLFRYCMTRVNNREAAEDVTAEAFIRFMENGNSMKAENPKAWLVSIARNIVRDRYDKERVRKTNPQSASSFDWERIAADEDDVEKSALDAAFVDIIKQMMNELPDSTREIIVLHIWEGLTFLEISEVIEEKEITVKQRYYRAIDEMRKTQDKKARSLTIPLVIAAIREQSKLPEFAVSQSLQNKISLSINNRIMESNPSRFHITQQGALLIAGVSTVAVALAIVLVVWVSGQTGTYQAPTVQPTPKEEVVIEPEPTPEPFPAEPELQTFTHTKLPGFSMRYYDDWTVTVKEFDQPDNGVFFTNYFDNCHEGCMGIQLRKGSVNADFVFHKAYDGGGVACSDTITYTVIGSGWTRFDGILEEGVEDTHVPIYSYSNHAWENSAGRSIYNDPKVYKVCDSHDGDVLTESIVPSENNKPTPPFIVLEKPRVTGNAEAAKALLAEIDAIVLSITGLGW